MPLIDRSRFRNTVNLLAVRVPKERCSELVRELRQHVYRPYPEFRAVIKEPLPLAPATVHLSQPPVDTPSPPAEGRMIILKEGLRADNLSAELLASVKSAEGELRTHSVELGYDELSAQEVLRALLPSSVEVPTGFETVGHLVHFNLRPEHLPHRRLIGEVMLDKLPHVTTVVNKCHEIDSEFRALPLELIAGEADYRVRVKHGPAAILEFDYSKVYWNSRLHTEHQRLADSFSPGALVWDLFAGVGPFAVLAARRAVRVLANDLNPEASDALVRNAQLNKVAHLINVYNLDASEFVTRAVAAHAGAPATQTLSASRLAPTAAQLKKNSKKKQLSKSAPSLDLKMAAAMEAELPAHVLMNLPAGALEFVPALKALRECVVQQGSTNVPLVHCYAFSRAAEEDREAEALERLTSALEWAPKQLRMHVVRSVAPGKVMLCYEFRLGA